MLFAEFARFDELPAAVEKLKSGGRERVDDESLVHLSLGYRGEWAEDGALLSYGAHVSEAHARSAQLAHRILTGAQPAETPVEQASRFELILDLRTARALGVKIPSTLLARADRVIE
jgi:putative ABC transport system substrate-binding protein